MRLLILTTATLLVGLLAAARAEEEEITNERRLLMLDIDEGYVDAMLEYDNAQAEYDWRKEQFEQDDKRRFERKMEKAKEDMVDAREAIKKNQSDATKDYSRRLEKEDAKLRKLDGRLERASDQQRERAEPMMQEMRMKLDFYQDIVRNLAVLEQFSVWQDRNGKPQLRPAPGSSPRKLQWQDLPKFTAEVFGRDEPYDSSKREGILVLVFWSVLNDGSMDLLKDLDRMQRQYRDQQVEYLAVNLNDSMEALRDELGRSRLSLTLAKDAPPEGSKRDKPLSDIFSVRFAPTVFVTDHKGVVQHILVGYSKRHNRYLREMLDRLIEREAERRDAAAE